LAANTLTEGRELLRYGVQRVPGDFIHMALLTLPATFVAHLHGVQEAGFVAFGISLLTMAGAVFTPVGSILLPKASEMLAKATHSELREHILRIVQITATVSAILTLLFVIFASPLIRIYLGPDFGRVAWVIRLVALGAVPYCLFLVLRNVIDAFHENAVTGAILMGALVVFGVASAAASSLGAGLLGILLAFLAGLLTLGAVSTAECARILARKS
ncbi:MAG: oligosaccharide flippase family protein, partial [Acidobacteria bacterium]|nr:oligosaccharide flippase family protein [Acidobacteriota bacterium]